MRAILVLIAASFAASVPDTNWWETALVYQIYPRSFKDTNDDGIGDLNGITSKLDYLKKTGVDAIWLSPIFLSPMYDFGYDISDYRQIAPEYGTMEDFQNLIKTAKEVGIRVVLDLVPNHTSNESDWFIRSVRREPHYENYYIWADGIPDPEHPGELLPPSNWISVFGNGAWEYNKERGQYYLHQFVIGQPDLNYREPKVQQEMNDVIRFWLDKGVSGFRVDAVIYLYEADSKNYNGSYPDEPLSGKKGFDSDDYDYLNHIYTRDLNETYDVIYNWRDVMDEYIEKDGENKLMMTEAYTSLANVMKYYGTGKRNGSVPFNFSLLENINNQSTAFDIKLVIDKWMTYMPVGKTANWVNGNHDQSRLASRLGDSRVDAMNMLALILPGIAVTYQGEEIGMTDGFVSLNDTKDPQALNPTDPIKYWKKSRDPERTPYHWDASKHAGFSQTTGKTWLPIADNYKTLNLAAQMSAEKSHYKFYKDVATARKCCALREGDLHVKALSESLLVVTRLLPGTPGIIGLINLSSQEQIADLSSIKLLPNKLLVVASGVDCELEIGAPYLKSNLPLSGHCAAVLKTADNCC
ncbi:maltase A1-like [Epargyreus clarus]|uniref:maltase A1-like n=1 Tax=Epargyreus clarus TaxID=520877 RepID=UPI003C3036E9